MKAIALILALALLAGCVTKIPYDIDGSRSDGILVMGVDGVSMLTTIDWESASKIALEKCRAWGYEGAEGFSGVRRSCGQSVCYVERKYQCLSDKFVAPLPPVSDGSEIPE